MGFNDQNSARLVFDIETAPLTDAAEYLESAEAPANYKDEAKIKAYIAEKNAENLDRCGLDADLCRIVAIGYMGEGDDAPTVLMDDDPTDAINREMLTIRKFWRAVGDRHLVGFNCLAFDLPVLLRRSLYLNIETPFIQIDKFKHPQVTDLQMVLSFNGALKLRGLSFYARRFGFDVADTITGADVAQAVADGRWSDIATHVRADVEKTALLAARVGCFHLAATESVI